MGFERVMPAQDGLIDGTGKPVARTKDAIKAAVLGDTNFVSTADYDSVVLVADEDADDVSLSVGGDHVQSYTLEEIDTAIRDFLAVQV
jgi:hypothetical protein